MSEPQNQAPTGEAVSPRDEAGRFKPGFSGNPGGKPAGSSRKRFEQAFYSIAEEHQEAILQRLVTDALAGEAHMMRSLIDRLVRRPEHVDDETGGAAATRLEIVFVNPDGGGEDVQRDDGEGAGGSQEGGGEAPRGSG